MPRGRKPGRKPAKRNETETPRSTSSEGRTTTRSRSSRIRTVARALEKELIKRDEIAKNIATLEKELGKLRVSCPHESVSLGKDGKVCCKDCMSVIAQVNPSEEGKAGVLLPFTTPTFGK